MFLWQVCASLWVRRVIVLNMTSDVPTSHPDRDVMSPLLAVKSHIALLDVGLSRYQTFTSRQIPENNNVAIFKGNLKKKKKSRSNVFYNFVYCVFGFFSAK